MPTITYRLNDGTSASIDAAEGTTLMRAALNNSVPGIIGECGGQAMCATCHVYVANEYVDSLPAVSDDEDEMLECTEAARTDRSRLGCQITVNADLPTIVVDVPGENF